MISESIKNEMIEIVVKQVAKNNAPYCGDSYYYITTDRYFLCLIADGLGSGKFAYESSNLVKEIVCEYHHLPLEELFDRCNEVLAHKRGAAVAILKVAFEDRQFQYLSVGNIRFFLYVPSTKKMIYPLPTSGYLSGKARKFVGKTYPYEPNSKFILYSDGLELKEIKTYLSKNQAIERISDDIWGANIAHSDDTTFIMGSLLQ